MLSKILTLHYDKICEDTIELPDDAIAFAIESKNIKFKYNNKYMDSYVIITKQKINNEYIKINDYYLNILHNVIFVDNVKQDDVNKLHTYLGDIYFKYRLPFINSVEDYNTFIGITKINKFNYSNIEEYYIGNSTIFNKAIDIAKITNDLDYILFYNNIKFDTYVVGDFKEEYFNSVQKLFTKFNT